MFAGAASGAIGVTALAPVEVIRVNLMVDGGTWRTALQSLSRGWWRGNTADVLSAAPRVGITMASFAMYKRLLTVALREETTPQWAVFMAGALAGATATLATFPLDVVRTRMRWAARSTGSGRRSSTAWCRSRGPRAAARCTAG